MAIMDVTWLSFYQISGLSLTLYAAQLHRFKAQYGRNQQNALGAMSEAICAPCLPGRGEYAKLPHRQQHYGHGWA